MEYKKIFDLNLNNKKFAIFIDDNNRYTFLEIDSSGEYTYPLLEDFLLLHNVYNNRNPFIVNVVKKLTFQEGVKVGIAASLAFVTLMNFVPKFGNSVGRLDANIEGEELVISENTDGPQFIELNSPSDLEKILDLGKVSEEQVRQAINNNDNLPNEYKILCHILLDEIVTQCPEADLRIFYFNVKGLNVNEISSSDLQKKTKQAGVAANYNVISNTINIDITGAREFKIHELGHILTSLYEEIDDTVIYRTCSYGHALDEAKNNKVAGLVSKMHSYYKEGEVFDFLCTCVDFTLEDCINKRVADLISSLKEKYPDVDVNFIVKTLDAIKTTNTNFGVSIPLDANMSFLDELFLICKKNIQEYPNCYTAFTNFAKVLEYAKNKDLVYTYLDEYNEHLKSLGITNIVTSEELKAKAEEFNRIGGFAYNEDNFYPLIKFEEEINDKIIVSLMVLKDEEYINSVGFGEQRLSTKDISYLVYSYPENKDLYGTQEYWKKMALNAKAFGNHDILPMKFYFNDKYVGEEFINKVTVRFGLTNRGELAYKLVDYSGNTIYASSDEMNHLTSMISLKDYLCTNTSSEKMELSYYLNEYYLKLFILENPDMIKGISIENSRLVVNTDYMLRVKINEELLYIDVITSSLKVNEQGKLELFPYGIVIDGDTSLEYYPSLKEILNSYNILTANQKEYTIDVEELNNIISEYLNNLNVNKAR